MISTRDQSTLDRAFKQIGEASLRMLGRVFDAIMLHRAPATPREKPTQAKLAHKASQDRRNEHLWDAYIIGKPYRKVERFTHEDKMVARVGYIDARLFNGKRLVNEPMRDELRVSQRVEAMERWYETTGAEMKHFYKHKEYLDKWFSAPPVKS